MLLLILSFIYFAFFFLFYLMCLDFILFIILNLKSLFCFCFWFPSLFLRYFDNHNMINIFLFIVFWLFDIFSIVFPKLLLSFVLFLLSSCFQLLHWRSFLLIQTFSFLRPFYFLLIAFWVRGSLSIYISLIRYFNFASIFFLFYNDRTFLATFPSLMILISIYNSYLFIIVIYIILWSITAITLRAILRR